MKDKNPQLKDNLQTIKEAKQNMNREEVMQFYRVFVGALSGHVEKETWDFCIEMAIDCLQSTRGASSV